MKRLAGYYDLSPLAQGGGAGLALGSASAIDPATLGSQLIWYHKNGTGLYQDAAKSTPATADADPVWTWADQSGNGHDWVTDTDVTHAPALKTNIVNGHSVVRGDGVNDTLSHVLFGAALAQPYAIFMACTVPGVVGRGPWFRQTGGSNCNLTYNSASGGGSWILNGGSNLSLTGGGTTGWGVCMARFNGASSKALRNLAGVTGAGGSNSCSGVRVFATSVNGGSPYAMDIAECFCVSSPTSQQEDGLAAWLNQLVSAY